MRVLALLTHRLGSRRSPVRVTRRTTRARRTTRPCLGSGRQSTGYHLRRSVRHEAHQQPGRAPEPPFRAACRVHPEARPRRERRRRQSPQCRPSGDAGRPPGMGLRRHGSANPRHRGAGPGRCRGRLRLSRHPGGQASACPCRSAIDRRRARGDLRQRRLYVRLLRDRRRERRPQAVSTDKMPTPESRTLGSTLSWASARGLAGGRA